MKKITLFLASLLLVACQPSEFTTLELQEIVDAGMDLEAGTIDLSSASLTEVPHLLDFLPNQDDRSRVYQINLSDNEIAAFDELSLEGFPNLSILDLSDNSLMSLTTTGALGLSEINLSDNDITSVSLVAEVGLIEVDLSDNDLVEIGEDVFPVDLEKLNLSDNNLIGISGLSWSQIRVLDLSDNKIEGKAMKVLGRMPRLRAVELSGNRVAESIVRRLEEAIGGIQ